MKRGVGSRDGKLIQSHKIILTTNTNCFSNIRTKNCDPSGFNFVMQISTSDGAFHMKCSQVPMSQLGEIKSRLMLKLTWEWGMQTGKQKLQVLYKPLGKPEGH